MDDTNLCPMCNSKLHTATHKNIFLPEIGSWGDFLIKTCRGTNHLLKLIVDHQQVVWLLCSLDSKYTKFLEQNYKNQSSTILCSKNNIRHKIYLHRLFNLDFPLLIKVKEKVMMYVALS